uniref:Uncharacterized protein n=1 Tax=Graphocephala atropunctata TaxID=36148 RepID=A0A1B6KAZ0_9HEMI
MRAEHHLMGIVLLLLVCSTTNAWFSPFAVPRISVFSFNKSRKQESVSYGLDNHMEENGHQFNESYIQYNELNSSNERYAETNEHESEEYEDIDEYMNVSDEENIKELKPNYDKLYYASKMDNDLNETEHFANSGENNTSEVDEAGSMEQTENYDETIYSDDYSDVEEEPEHQNQSNSVNGQILLNNSNSNYKENYVVDNSKDNISDNINESDGDYNNESYSEYTNKNDSEYNNKSNYTNEANESDKEPKKERDTNYGKSNTTHDTNWADKQGNEESENEYDESGHIYSTNEYNEEYNEDKYQDENSNYDSQENSPTLETQLIEQITNHSNYKDDSDDEFICNLLE